jgi:hypothetical protein
MKGVTPGILYTEPQAGTRSYFKHHCALRLSAWEVVAKAQW